MRDESSVVIHSTARLTKRSKVLVWHAGSPHTGALLEPVCAAASNVGREVLTVARPGYGEVARRRGRTVGDGVRDVVRVVENLELDDVVMVGYSGGGPHAIASAAALPRQTGNVVTFGSIAPYSGTSGWFSGMADETGLRAALAGAAARSAHNGQFNSAVFTDRDYVALAGPWAALGIDAEDATRRGDEGGIDDDLAFVQPWDVPLHECLAPVRLVHGRQDRVVPISHATVLARHLPSARVITHELEGHVSILEYLEHHLAAAGSRGGHR